jgi:membrane protein
VRNFFVDSGLDQAAAVAFYSMLSTPPLLYLLGTWISWLFEDRFSTESLLAHFSAFVPEEVIRTLSQFHLGLRGEKGLVVLALPALVWGAIRGFTAIGRALNRVFRSRRLGVGIGARLKGLAILVAGLIVLGAATVVASLLPTFSREMARLGMPRVPVLLETLNSLLLSPLVGYATFTLIYKFVPATRVRWRPALGGSLLTVVLWEGARRLFSRFLALSHGFGLLGGSVAAIVAYLLWTYTGMAILLLGAELAAILNGRDDPHRRRRSPLT